MSLRPDSVPAPPPPRKKVTLKRQKGPWEPWRKVMLTGALLLWVFYVGVTATKTVPSPWLQFPVNFVGYGLLSVGFVLRMRDRRTAREKSESKP